MVGILRAEVERSFAVLVRCVLKETSETHSRQTSRELYHVDVGTLEQNANDFGTATQCCQMQRGHTGIVDSID